MKDKIEYRGISRRDLAQVMEMPYSALNVILDAKKPLTAKTALQFEAALDVPAYSLMNLQSKYDMQVAMQDIEVKNWLSGIRRVAATVLI